MDKSGYDVALTKGTVPSNDVPVLLIVRLPAHASYEKLNGTLYRMPFYLVKAQTFFVKLNKAQPHCIEQIHEILRNG